MIRTRVQIDGVDKTGKDMLVKYITRMSNHKYVIQARGIVSQIAYSKIYGRDYEYDLDNYENDVIVLLTGDIEDLKIRHKITNEPKIDIERDLKVFGEVAEELSKRGLTVYQANTSHLTPYEVAEKVIAAVEKKERKLCLKSKIKELS